MKSSREEVCVLCRKQAATTSGSLGPLCEKCGVYRDTLVSPPLNRQTETFGVVYWIFIGLVFFVVFGTIFMAVVDFLSNLF